MTTINSQLLNFHLMLLNDDDRMRRYREAVFCTVKPGDVVLDLGTGTGVIALFSCQAGARRVYAVERGDVIVAARELIRKNGFADRVVFLKQDINELNLEEGVDVITSELIAKAVLGENMAELVGNCRDRFLKSGGRILPERVDLWIAPVDCESLYRQACPPASSTYDINFDNLRFRSVNNAISSRIPVPAMLADEKAAYSYKAYSAENSDRFDAVLQFTPSRDGTLHGFAAWFSACLAEDVTLSNKPPVESSWDNLFFPLDQPQEIAPDTTIDLNMQGRSDSQVQDLWIWNTKVLKAGEVIAEHRQSSFAGRVLSAELLQRASDQWAPAINMNGKIALATLNLMERGKTLEEIALEVCTDFPGRFVTNEEAIGTIRGIAERFSE